jgi:hypothetical protein
MDASLSTVPKEIPRAFTSCGTLTSTFSWPRLMCPGPVTINLVLVRASAPRNCLRHMHRINYYGCAGALAFRGRLSLALVPIRPCSVSPTPGLNPAQQNLPVTPRGDSSPIQSPRIPSVPHGKQHARSSPWKVSPIDVAFFSRPRGWRHGRGGDGATTGR